MAEPNLVALSGDTASFLAGGTILRSRSQLDRHALGRPPNYGVGLSFTPTVLNDGMIDLVIKPEVSEIDPSIR